VDVVFRVSGACQKFVLCRLGVKVDFNVCYTSAAVLVMPKNMTCRAPYAQNSYVSVLLLACRVTTLRPAFFHAWHIAVGGVLTSWRAAVHSQVSTAQPHNGKQP
jgi:hypothetical protein